MTVAPRSTGFHDRAMRWLALIVAGCGKAATTAAVAPAALPASKPLTLSSVDPFAALAETAGEVSWLLPGKARLDDGGATFQAAKPAPPLAVRVVEQHGNTVRAAVRLDELRFLVWTDRAHLLAVLRHDQRVSSLAGAEFVDLSSGDPMQAVLRRGARVQRLAHKTTWTQVRYFGALEVDGWVPDEALADRAEPGDPMGRVPTGRQVLTLLHGAVIRTEPKWTGREIAVMANGYFVDTIQKVDEAWTEVGYADGEVIVHGYVSTRDPPGRVHHVEVAESPPPPVAPNATAAAGTCLYARDDGEPIGYVVKPLQVELAAGAHPGWMTLGAETPWGPITFVAKGSDKAALATCAPPGVVPAPATTPPP